MDIKVKSHLKPCAAVSIAIMVVALVMTLTGHGMNLGVDFTGGTIMTYNMGEQFETADVEKVLADNGISDAQIAKTGENDSHQRQGEHGRSPHGAGKHARREIHRHGIRRYFPRGRDCGPRPD